MTTDPPESSKNLKKRLKVRLLDHATRIRGSFLPILFEQSTLKVKRVHAFSERSSRFYLIRAKNRSKGPKYRYLLGKVLAHQSSDFLVALARPFAAQNGLKLIQYSIRPRHPTVSLLALKEILVVEMLGDWLNLLDRFKASLRKKMLQFRALLENEGS